MKFQTKIILYYTSIALALSLLLGIVLYKTGLDRERQSQESALTTTSTQLIAQMEDRLGRMEAIIYYVLSDADMLSSMKILGMVSDGTVPISYIREAEETMRVGLRTEYLQRNSYRSGFYNQTGFYFTSFVRSDDEMDVSERYQALQDPEGLPYLEKASLADGKTVVIGIHPDPWVGEDGILVYSVMKAVRGYQMGYLEIENTIDSLAELNTSDPYVDYLIFLNGEELLFNSQKSPFSEAEISQLLQEHLESGSNQTDQGQGLPRADQGQNSSQEKKKKGSSVLQSYLTAWQDSEEFPITILAIKPRSALADTAGTLVETAVWVALAVFVLGVIFIILYSRILSKPLKQLQDQIAHANLENLSQEEHVKIDSKGMDELEVLVDTYHSMTKRLNQAVENEKRSLTLQMSAQFDTLQAQVNPHFIYNILNIISSRGIENNDDMICEICNALAMILRYSTNNKERIARIGQEASYLENYLYLAKVRYGKKMRFQVDIDPEVQEQMIPKLTLQQFAENSLAHGFDHMEGDWEIRFTGRMKKSYWEILIQDNGEGLSEEVRTRIEEQFREVRETILGHQKNMELEIGGMGLVNTYARCLLFYGKNVIFEILPGETGAVFRIGAYMTENTAQHT